MYSKGTIMFKRLCRHCGTEFYCKGTGYTTFNCGNLRMLDSCTCISCCHINDIMMDSIKQCDKITPLEAIVREL
jgi:hypothetical protein